MQFIDAHAHLEWPTISAQVHEMIERATSAGVTHIVGSASRSEDIPRCLALLDRYPSTIHYTVGIHPEYCLDPDNSLHEFQKFFEDNSQRFVGIGEIGLDYLVHKDPAQRIQTEVIFRELIRFAQEQQQPIVIHCRYAEKQALRILGEFHDLPGVILHCFGGAPKFIDEGLLRGYFFTIPTSITYKKLHQELAARIPIERVLLETDAPFLPPSPEISLNEPKYVIKVAEEIGRIKGVPIEDIANSTTQNAKTFFKL
jgi:TatD DNase family protein